MAFNLDDRLVVGIASSALFDARDEDRIFREHGIEAFIETQIKSENIPFKKGTAFPLIEALLRLNTLIKKPLVEVVVLSHNNPAAGLRAMNSVEHYGLGITRAAFVGCTPVAKYLLPYRVRLFLSRDESDVRAALQQGVAAGMLYDPPQQLCSKHAQLRIAFDGDAVIFSDESERVYQSTKSLEAFFEHERANAMKPMADGPFAAFLRWIAHVQADKSVRNADGSCPIRTALVTARNGPAIKRVFLTLRAWGVSVDEEFFLGGIIKAEVLQAFNPHIFFDDQDAHAAPASRLVSTARVMYGPTADVPLLAAESVVPLDASSHLLKAGPSAYDEVTRVPAMGPPQFRTKKACEARMRNIFLSYSPLNNGKLPVQYRKFIEEVLSRPENERAVVLKELDRVDLSSITTHEPMFNRGRDAMVASKLARILNTADATKQGTLNL